MKGTCNRFIGINSHIEHCSTSIPQAGATMYFQQQGQIFPVVGTTGDATQPGGDASNHLTSSPMSCHDEGKLQEMMIARAALGAQFGIMPAAEVHQSSAIANMNRVTSDFAFTATATAAQTDKLSRGDLPRQISEYSTDERPSFFNQARAVEEEEESSQLNMTLDLDDELMREERATCDGGGVQIVSFDDSLKETTNYSTDDNDSDSVSTGSLSTWTGDAGMCDPLPVEGVKDAEDLSDFLAVWSEEKRDGQQQRDKSFAAAQPNENLSGSIPPSPFPTASMSAAFHGQKKHPSSSATMEHESHSCPTFTASSWRADLADTVQSKANAHFSGCSDDDQSGPSPLGLVPSCTNHVMQVSSDCVVGVSNEKAQHIPDASNGLYSAGLEVSKRKRMQQDMDELMQRAIDDSRQVRRKSNPLPGEYYSPCKRDFFAPSKGTQSWNGHSSWNGQPSSGRLVDSSGGTPSPTGFGVSMPNGLSLGRANQNVTTAPLGKPQHHSRCSTPTTDRRGNMKDKFPKKLMDMLSKKDSQHAISWLPSGDAFAVVDEAALMEDVLPRVFGRDVKFTSFARKLKRWGFERDKSEGKGGVSVYRHEHFKRNSPESCSLIRTKDKEC